MLEADIKKKARRCIDKLICRIVYYSGLYAVLKLIYQDNGLYIFFYHNIVDKKENKKNAKPIPLNSVEIKSFERQLKYYNKEYAVITLDEALDLLKSKTAFDKKYLVITFDDGYRDNLTYGYDLFNKHKVFPTIYLTANNIEKGTYLWPDILKNLVYNSKKTYVNIDIYNIHYACSIKTERDRVKFLESITEDIKKLDEVKKQKVFELLSNTLDVEIKINCETMLNWNEVNSLSSIGVLIGAHTMNHPILANLADDDAENEIFGSKTLIEERTKKPVKHFAYPNGKYPDINEFCIGRVREYFQTAVTTIPGINTPETDLMRLKRIGLSYDLTIIDLKVKVLYFCMMDKLKKK